MLMFYDSNKLRNSGLIWKVITGRLWRLAKLSVLIATQGKGDPAA